MTFRSSSALVERDTVIVTGSRDFADRPLLERTLGDLFYRARFEGQLVVDAAILVNCGRLVHDGARGADAEAMYWAAGHGFEVAGYKVDHALDGPWPWAGPRRNERMLLAERARCVCVVAFSSPNGDLTRGTADCVDKAERLGLRVLRPR